MKFISVTLINDSKIKKVFFPLYGSISNFRFEEFENFLINRDDLFKFLIGEEFEVEDVY